MVKVAGVCGGDKPLPPLLTKKVICPALGTALVSQLFNTSASLPVWIVAVIMLVAVAVGTEIGAE